MRRAGFTLIELIVVIVLIGILAVTAAPRLLSRDSFESYAVREQLVSTLQQVQTMQMQDGSQCYRLHAELAPESEKYKYRFGIPEPDATCSTSLEATFSDGRENTTIVAFDSAITLISSELSIQFDQLGRPGGDCDKGCLINVDDLAVKIESEGYIHAL